MGKVSINADRIIEADPFGDVKNSVKKFQAKNGTFFLEWKLGNRTAGVNVGNDSFSYAICDTSTMSVLKTGDGLPVTDESITDFYFEVGLHLKHLKVSYVRNDSTSTGCFLPNGYFVECNTQTSA